MRGVFVGGGCYGWLVGVVVVGGCWKVDLSEGDRLESGEGTFGGRHGGRGVVGGHGRRGVVGGHGGNHTHQAVLREKILII